MNSVESSRFSVLHSAKARSRKVGLMRNDSTSQEFFEQKYRINSDFWNFASSPYEQGRYESILAALRNRHYGRAFEPGCSIGVLTERLAGICDRVEAMDIAPTAVEQARERCCRFTHVNVICGALPEIPFSGSFDLAVLSEIGYYFEPDTLHCLGTDLVRRLRPSGVLLATHWLGVSEDHRLSGDQVHDVLRSLQGVTLEHSEQHVRFRLDQWVRT